MLDGSEAALAAIDVLVVPSRTEGIPAVAIEAGLAQVPVVATDVGGVSSVVIDGVTGMLVETAAPDQLRAGIDRALDRGVELGRAAPAALSRPVHARSGRGSVGGTAGAGGRIGACELEVEPVEAIRRDPGIESIGARR